MLSIDVWRDVPPMADPMRMPHLTLSDVRKRHYVWFHNGFYKGFRVRSIGIASGVLGVAILDLKGYVLNPKP